MDENDKYSTTCRASSSNLQIANDVRGSVDGWDFKQYVLGALFYRFISENFSSYIAGDDSICYAKLDDSVITDDIKDDAIKTKGYFIYPSQLFCNVAAKANTNDRLNADLNSIFVAIESSAYGYPSEADIKGLFADFDTTSNRLGNTVKDKNARLAAVLKGVEGLKLGDFNEHQIDLFGDAQEFRFLTMRQMPVSQAVSSLHRSTSPG